MPTVPPVCPAHQSPIKGLILFVSWSPSPPQGFLGFELSLCGHTNPETSVLCLVLMLTFEFKCSHSGFSSRKDLTFQNAKHERRPSRKIIPQSEVCLKMKFRNFFPLKCIPDSGTRKVCTQEGGQSICNLKRMTWCLCGVVHVWSLSALLPPEQGQETKRRPPNAL